ncbi:hypothetical protein [Prosthecochloris sp. ZM]|uniref:hypothetical protein n=1 Tax=Prosthecochloris sp. ZM TaxID=2283143 RepID=UPI0012948272|nr:hypothetical protein [Prosthecochloris sp. ZM]
MVRMLLSTTKHGNDHIIDAVRCAMLIRRQGNLDLAGEETVWLKPVLTEPVFI